MSLRQKFETWCIKRNEHMGKGAKLDMTDKFVSKFFLGMLPRIILYIIVIGIAMRGYGKYGIERTMIVISWILIYSTIQNFAHIHKTMNIMVENQLEFFKKYDERKDKKIIRVKNHK